MHGHMVHFTGSSQVPEKLWKQKHLFWLLGQSAAYLGTCAGSAMSAVLSGKISSNKGDFLISKM